MLLLFIIYYYEILIFIIMKETRWGPLHGAQVEPYFRHARFIIKKENFYY